MGLLGVGALIWGATPAPVCLPGTSVCAVTDGSGAVRIEANANAQASPKEVEANGGATASGAAAGRADGQGPQFDGSTTGYYRPARGRRGNGLALCPAARVGLWSGFKWGGCFALSFRWEALTFELETQLLYGGVHRAIDWTFPVSFVIPLANGESLFEGPYLRLGGSPVGATFARRREGGSFVRFGVYAGAGYEWNVARWLAWRVVDVRLSLDMGTARAVDDRGNWLDPGLQVATAFIL